VALDTVYSRLRGLLDATSAARILGLLEALGLELYVDDLCRVDSSGRLAVLDGLDEFRQHLGGELTVPLLEGIGRAVEVHELDAITVEAAVRELSERGRHGPPASA
jgi:3-dehydroquinate synthase